MRTVSTSPGEISEHRDRTLLPTPLPRAVRRALDAMHGNVGHRWTIGELARVAGTSVRSLQRQFVLFLGKPPRVVLQDIGYERARRELLQGSGRERVMDVAGRCGFQHFGRFAVEYRRRFGETPSQTIKRQALFACDLALRAMPGVLSLDKEGNARALELLEQAIDRDPRQPLAVALGAWVHLQRVVYHFTDELRRERARGTELTQKALALCSDATTLVALGNALTLLGEQDAAARVIARALSVDGGSAWAWGRSGWIDVYRGDLESAIERFKIALDLAPDDPLAFNNQVGIGCAYFFAGAYAEAAKWQERALSEHPSAFWVHRTLCPTYVHANAKLQARRSLRMLRVHYPELTLERVRLGMPPLRPAHGDLIAGALAEAGLPA